MSSLGQEIYRAQDADGIIAVYQDGTRRVLTFGNGVEQSCMSLADPARLEYPYTQAMLLATLLGPAPRRALVLGLGGGSLVQALRRRWPRCRITAVEARTLVVEVAREYFFLREDPHLQVVIADAGRCLTDPSIPSQDLVLADLYLAEGASPRQTEGPFLAACRRVLSAGGVLALNLWCSDYGPLREGTRVLREVFDEQVLSVQVQGGNLVMLGLAGGIPVLERRRFFEQAQALGLAMDIPLQRHARSLWRQNAEALGIGRFRHGPGGERDLQGRRPP
jgi:spermidine synthase